MNRALTLSSHLNPHQPSGGTITSSHAPQKGGSSLSTLEKALTVNLDSSKYGVFCEIGAGQEVVRFFFLAGGASGTIAKSMSAYDKDVSDAIYGQEPGRRYVTKGRLQKMLDREFEILLERMPKERGKQTQYFVFSDTIAARSFKGGGNCHGWMGLKAQLYPDAEPSQIILHVRMFDTTNQQQQHALGILGVNLIYAMFYLKRDPYKLLDSLLEGVGRDRIEIDQCQLSGPYFDSHNPRLTALHLVTSGLTNAILFDASGSIVNAGDIFYKKDVLVLRGRFRPVTRVAVDMRASAEAMIGKKRMVTLAEISTRQLINSNSGVDYHKDFLSRVDVLCSQGFHVLVTDYLRFFRLREYLHTYTRRTVTFCMSVFNVIDLFQEHFYEGMEGGILEAMGRLFSGNVTLLVYPRQNPKDPNRSLITADNILTTKTSFDPSLHHLYAFLRETGKVIPVTGYEESILTIDTAHVLQDLQQGGSHWETVVPTAAVEMIKEKRLFGYNSH